MSFESTARSLGRNRLLAVAATGMLVAIPSLTWADSVVLGSAGNYAVLQFNGVADQFSDITVNGNVGVAGSSSLAVGSSSKVHGNVSVSSGATFTDGTNPSHNISGSVLTGQNLSGAVSDAENAFATYTALSPTQTLSGISTPKTFTGNGGTTVIDVNGNITGGITFSGGPNDLFVLNVDGDINLAGTTSILGSGISPNQIVIDIEGSHSFNTDDYNTIDGTVIAPHGNADLGGTINGRLFVGGSNLELMCGGVVNQPPAVPLPPTLWCTLSLAGGLLVVRGLRKPQHALGA